MLSVRFEHLRSFLLKIVVVQPVLHKVKMVSSYQKTRWVGSRAEEGRFFSKVLATRIMSFVILADMRLASILPHWRVISRFFFSRHETNWIHSTHASLMSLGDFIIDDRICRIQWENFV